MLLAGLQNVVRCSNAKSPDDRTGGEEAHPSRVKFSCVYQKQLQKFEESGTGVAGRGGKLMCYRYGIEQEYG